MRQYAGHGALGKENLPRLVARIPEPAAAPWLNASLYVTDKRAIGVSLMALLIFTQ